MTNVMDNNRQWIECSCICGLAGDREILFQLTSDATIGQIYARIRDQDVDIDPRLFNKILIAEGVFDFTDPHFRIMNTGIVRTLLRDSLGTCVQMQLIRDQDHPDYTESK